MHFLGSAKADLRQLHRRFSVVIPAGRLAPQNLHQLFKLEPHLLDDLLALSHVGPRLLATKLVARAADGEALLIEQTSDLTDHDHVLTLVVAAVATTLHRL